LNILACDLATTLGWAFGNLGGAPIWGHHRNGGRAGASVGAKLDDYANWLERQIATLKPDSIWLETPFVGRDVNASTVLLLYGLAAFTAREAWRRDITLHRVTTHEVTKFFLGSAGRRRVDKKAATIARCLELGWRVESDDEADALALFCLAEARLAPRSARVGLPLLSQHRP